jgi:hypothetical protein
VYAKMGINIKILEIIALRNENLLHVNLKLKLFKKYHTINSLNVSKIIQHNARTNNSQNKDTLLV